MHIEYHKWYSERLGREMELKVYGHYGKPILVFPSSGGRFHEFEDFKMIEAASSFIEQGKVKFICIDSIDKETWLNKSATDEHIGGRHEAFHRYVIQEVVPFIYQLCGGKIGIGTHGCSMGAYHAANFFFKEPGIFDAVLAFSGVYNIKKVLQRSYGIEEIYFNSPLDYLPNMNDPWYLARYRESKIVICVGQGAWEDEMIEDTAALKSILASKQVDAWIDFWGHDVEHDWPWWRKQIVHFLPSIVE